MHQSLLVWAPNTLSLAMGDNKYIYIYIYCLCWEFLEKSARNIITTSISNKHTIIKIAIIINSWPFFKGRPSVWRFSVSCPPYFCSDENEKLFVNVYIYKQICIFDTFTTINILTSSMFSLLFSKRFWSKFVFLFNVFVSHANAHLI